MNESNPLITSDPIEVIRAGVIEVPGIPYTFNYIAGALGLFLGGNDLLSGLVAGFAVPLALPPNESANDGVVDDDGTVGGNPDPGNPPSDPKPDPDPDPKPDPDPGPDPEPKPKPKPKPDPTPLTPKEALSVTRGKWSESAAGAYIEITTSDRYVSFKAVYSGERVVLTLDEVKGLSPNNVRFVGLSRTALSSECGSSFGVDIYTLMVKGHADVYGYSTGFYLLEALDRDRVAAGYPSSFTSASSFVDIDAFFVQATRIHGTRQSNLSKGSSRIRGENWGTQTISEEYSFTFGSSGDQNGVVTPLTSVGDVVREMISSKRFYSQTDGEIWFAPYNAWGKASTKKYAGIVTPNSVLRALTLILKNAGVVVSFENLEALSLNYIDNPETRKSWDAVALSDVKIRISGSWSTRVAPFLNPGERPK